MDIKQNPIFSIIGIILCFILFIVSMLYVEQITLLTIVGILCLATTGYLVSRIVTRAMKNQS